MRLFAGKLSMVCLLAGILTLGELGIQRMNRPVLASEPDRPVAADGAETWDTEAQMEAEYQRLEEKEEETRMLLKEREAELKAGAAAGQSEVMELQEQLRRVQLQKTVLKSRIIEKSFDK